MEENSYSLLSLNRELIALDEDLKVKAKEFEEYRDKYLANKKRILDRMNIAKHSVDAVKFEHGIDILRLEFPGTRRYNDGPVTYKMIYTDLISDAKRDLANGAVRLKKVYFGQKQYEGYDQREDHAYGMGPRHGSIYQRIGLKKPSEELSDYDIECALYVLENIDVKLENLNAR
jgi:hypothetical protein